MWRGPSAGRVAKAVLISAVPPVMVKSAANPGGLPIEVFDGFRAAARRESRPVLHRGADRARSTASTAPAPRSRKGVIDNWWRQGMMGAANAHYECIKAFSETDFTEDLKKIDGAGPGRTRHRRPDRPVRGRRAPVGGAPARTAG